MTFQAYADNLAGEVGIDPLTVLAFLSAILPILTQCFSPQDAEEYFRQDTVATRRRIRLACDKEWRRQHGVNAPKKLVLALQHRLATMPQGVLVKIIQSN